MEKKKQRSEVSSTEAVLLGALAPGVNVRMPLFFLPFLSMLFIRPYLDWIFLTGSNMEHSQIIVSYAGSLSHFHALHSLH
uniref:Uncharacterized protein n=1 Tax=Brassica campestris TaxID=3711 RepID=M4D335_BRACM